MCFQLCMYSRETHKCIWVCFSSNSRKILTRTSKKDWKEGLHKNFLEELHKNFLEGLHVQPPKFFHLCTINKHITLSHKFIKCKFARLRNGKKRFVKELSEF